MRRLLVASVAAAAFAAMAGQASAQIPRHFHPLETPSGKTHLLAPGVTTHASCQGFLNFHENVHHGVFGSTFPFPVEGKHPLGPLTPVTVFPIDPCP